MKIYIASDHGGYRLKGNLTQFLKTKGHDVTDFGNNVYNPDDDYPDFVLPLAQKVAFDTESFGITIGRSGNGEAIAANKVRGVRAVVCVNEIMAKKAREDNNANILSLGANYISMPQAERIVQVFLETPFSTEERHARRMEKITSYESGG